MKNVYTFNKTVQGSSHLLRGVNCEDSSVSFFSPDGSYFIAAVADGHGSDMCFRSSIGSRIAAQVALDCLKEFAEKSLPDNQENGETESPYCRSLKNDSKRADILRQLTDSIIFQWDEKVRQHARDNPVTQEEMGVYADFYSDGSRLTHIYGTTLIAALLLPCCLILIQQGDGRCDLFYEDGSVCQPIPWDDRCQDVVTTSMCDDDAADSIRTFVLFTQDRLPAACFLASDGVEDAYRDSPVNMEGVHTFFKNLCVQITYNPPNDFERYLDDMLPVFSASGLFSQCGSGDDVSVAGIVNRDAVAGLCLRFQQDITAYSAKEEIFRITEKLNSMREKHDTLKNNYEKAKEMYEPAAQERLKPLYEEMSRLSRKRSELTENCRETENMLRTLMGKAQDEPVPFTAEELSGLLADKTSDAAELAGKIIALGSSISQTDSDIENAREKYLIETENLEKLRDAYHAAKNEFDEYDTRCSSLKARQEELRSYFHENRDNE